MTVLRTPVGVTLLVALAMLMGTLDAAWAPLLEAPAESTAGRLLVASPDLDDPNFHHTVIYVIQHDEQGAMGLVINRVLATGPLDKLLENLDMPVTVEADTDIQVHFGGPVEQGRGFVLHSPEYRAEGTIPLSDLAAMTPSLRVLEDMAAGNGPARSLFALGYAGWGPRQLDGEIASGAWVIVDADEALLFDSDMDAKWQQALDRQGVEL